MGRIVGPQPPGGDSRWVELIRLKALRVAKLITTDRYITGRMVHWHEGRTRLCGEGTGGCPEILHKSPRKWRGYMAVIAGPGSAQSILELTPELANQIEGAWPVREDFRGLVLELRRGGSHNSRIYLEQTSEWRGNLDLLPKALDVGLHVKRILES